MPLEVEKEERPESTPRKPLDYWDKWARRVIRIEMAKAGETPESLAELLKDSGFGENTEKALAQRIVRGSFNFGFALRVLNAMGVKSLDISYVKTHKPSPPATVRPGSAGQS